MVTLSDSQIIFIDLTQQPAVEQRFFNYKNLSVELN